MGLRIQLDSPDLDPSVLESPQDYTENAAQAELASEGGPGCSWTLFNIPVRTLNTLNDGEADLNDVLNNVQTWHFLIKKFV